LVAAALNLFKITYKTRSSRVFFLLIKSGNSRLPDLWVVFSYIFSDSNIIVALPFEQLRPELIRPGANAMLHPQLFGYTQRQQAYAAPDR
jgi:hypothetical protein